ncbi:MAG: EamA family transporter [Clostridia bacterium]|nr:EamA family transporter [Clostridia bacterium]
MNIILLIFSIAMNLLSCAFLRNDYCKREIRNPRDLYVFNACSGAVSAVVLLLISLIMGDFCAPSLYTLVLGIVFGVATALCAVFGMMALETGPLSYTNIISSCSMVIPALSGAVLFSETVSVWQYVGIAFMVVSFSLAVDKKNNEAGTSLKWFLLCMVAFFSNGAIGVMQKIHQNSPHKEELGVFLVIAFTVYVVFSICMALGYRKKGLACTVASPEKRRKLIVYAVISGFGVAACNQINMYLTGVMPAIIFFPVFNGTVMLLTTLIGILVWKEKLSKKQWVGIAAGGAAILLLCDIIK